MLPALGAI
jgi:hypothetical protein